MSQGQAPTFQSLVEQLKPETRRRIMRIFNRFGDIDQEVINKLIEWSYERGKADAISGVSEIVNAEKARMTSTFNFSKWW